MGRNKAFFLDRDGVMIEEKNYLADPANVCLCPGCAEALRKIAAAGYRIRKKAQNQMASLARPLARRARMTLRPFLVLMRFRKPCTRLR